MHAEEQVEQTLYIPPLPKWHPLASLLEISSPWASSHGRYINHVSAFEVQAAVEDRADRSEMVGKGAGGAFEEVSHEGKSSGSVSNPSNQCGMLMPLL
jgi:hypothetical protein